MVPICESSDKSLYSEITTEPRKEKNECGAGERGNPRAETNKEARSMKRTMGKMKD